jgi:hypothetical protein
MADLFSLMNNLLEFGLKNNLKWSLRFSDKPFIHIPVIENHLKEVS